MFYARPNPFFLYRINHCPRPAGIPYFCFHTRLSRKPHNNICKPHIGRKIVRDQMVRSNIFLTIFFRDIRQSCMTIGVRSVGDNVEQNMFNSGALSLSLWHLWSCPSSSYHLNTRSSALKYLYDFTINSQTVFWSWSLFSSVSNTLKRWLKSLWPPFCFNWRICLKI